MKRKDKLRVLQFSLFLIGTIFAVYTYTIDKPPSTTKEILTPQVKDSLKTNFQNTDDKNIENIFYNIEYSGLDLAGNRYVLKSKKAKSDPFNEELIVMIGVEATFYFKDETILKILSKDGIYNNKTFDMDFFNSVKANYEGSRLIAEKAEYSNSLGFLTISKNVKVNDVQGNLVADKLFFDIKKQTLKIDSFKDDKINVNINLNEKRF